MQEHKTIYFKEYTPSPYTIVSCSLEFIIEESSTRVENIMEVQRRDSEARELKLDGEMLDLELLWVDDILYSDDMYIKEESAIRIPLDRDTARIRIINRIYPDQNTDSTAPAVSGVPRMNRKGSDGSPILSIDPM